MFDSGFNRGIDVAPALRNHRTDHTGDVWILLDLRWRRDHIHRIRPGNYLWRDVLEPRIPGAGNAIKSAFDDCLFIDADTGRSILFLRRTRLDSPLGWIEVSRNLIKPMFPTDVPWRRVKFHARQTLAPQHPTHLICQLLSPLNERLDFPLHRHNRFPPVPRHRHQRRRPPRRRPDLRSPLGWCICHRSESGGNRGDIAHTRGSSRIGGRDVAQFG